MCGAFAGAGEEDDSVVGAGQEEGGVGAGQEEGDADGENEDVENGRGRSSGWPHALI